MKTIIAVALLTLSTVLRAQVGATADAISVPEFGGAKVLHHCTVIEVQTDGVKFAHDDGVSMVPTRFLPTKFQKAVEARNSAEAAAIKKEFAEAYRTEPKVAGEEPLGSEPQVAASGESTSAIAAGASGSTNEEGNLMAHKSHSKTSHKDAISIIAAPVVHRRSPKFRIIRFIPIPYYYVPWPAPSVTAPQFTIPSYTPPYQWDQ